MTAQLTRYRKQMPGLSRRRLARWKDTEVAEWSPAAKGLSVVGLAAAAGLVAAGIYFMPDFIRYLKIRRM